MSGIELIGYIAGTLTTISLVPEIYRTWKRKKAKDLSFYWLGALSLGVAIWIVYGTMIAAWPVIIANSISLVLCIVQILLAMKYDKIKIRI